jgi:two-component system, chemotaxis family, protein-glutamate methylesterase/glutaminase
VSSVGHSISDASTELDTREVAVAVVVISASAGGLLPLRSLLRALPGEVPAAIVVAKHMQGTNLLPQILSADTAMPVTSVTSGSTLRSGVIYVCPGARHVVVNPDATVTLSHRERVNYVRPNGDWLFVSAAASFRERAFGVVLSGYQNDGSAGALAIRAAGGIVFAQDPMTCERPDMPNAAIATGAVSYVLAPEELATTLTDRLRAVDARRCRAEWDAPFAVDAA